MSNLQEAMMPARKEKFNKGYVNNHFGAEKYRRDPFQVAPRHPPAPGYLLRP